MKCPTCSTDTRALVVESRRHEGDVYRRRSCGKCGASFITVERAPAGLKMPAPVRNGVARGAHQPRRADKPVQFNSAAHLDRIFKR